jgi:mono/diheme cytochrome c family protein
MSPESHHPLPAADESSEESRTTVPVWLIVLLFLLLYWGALHFDHRGGWFDPKVYAPYRSFAELEVWQPPAPGAGNLARGREVYNLTCALCHDTDGSGKPGQAPPLAGVDWVTGSPARLIRIPLYGLTGPIRVLDQEWNMSMVAMGAALPDEDVAAVLTYIRNAWGNEASPITPEQVRAVREEVGNRPQPFTATELLQIQ